MLRQRHIFKFMAGACTALVMALFMQSCFTGVEHTGHITLSKKDKQTEHRISREEAFMADIKGETASLWLPGRKFYVTGERASLAFDGRPDSMDGRILLFDSITYRHTPGGTDRVNINFSDSAGHRYIYPTGKQSPDLLLSTELPMLIDLSLVSKLREKLVGRHLWTLFSTCQNIQGEQVKTLKFAPVTVTDVRQGNEGQPYLIIFSDESGRDGAVLMSEIYGNLATRPFHTLFSLSEPRTRYPGISDEMWQVICASSLAKGMTKQEARLSIGSPDDTDSWHDYSKTIDVWTYANGIYLRFEDGLLTEFRR